MTTTMNTQQQMDEKWYARFREKYPNGWVATQTEQNGYHDSYFYETIYDADTGTWTEEATGATAYSSGPYTSGLPFLKNAPQDVRDAALEAKRKQTYEFLCKQIPELVREWITIQADEAKKAKKGDTVRSLRKIKDVPKGTVGVVTWIGTDQFSEGVRYGVEKDDGERFYVNHVSVEIVARLDDAPVPVYEVNVKGCDALARRWADNVGERQIYRAGTAVYLDVREIARDIALLVIAK